MGETKNTTKPRINTRKAIVFYLVSVWVVVRGEDSSKVSTNCTFSEDDQYHGVKVDCSFGNFSTVPRNLPINTTSLYLNHNNIQHLLNNQFSQLLNLKYLNLNLNPIRAIQEDAFSNLNQLQEIQLYGHNLNYSESALPDESLKPLKSLKLLNIRSNLKISANISSSKGFRHLWSLESLAIDAIEFNVGFSELKNLKHLDLSKKDIDGATFGCQLAYVTNSTFSVFKTVPILTLDLENCLLYNIERNAFAPFLKLENIILIPSASSLMPFPEVIKTLHVFENRTLKSVKIVRFSPKIDSITTAGYDFNIDLISNICIWSLDLQYNGIAMCDASKFVTFPIPILTKCLRHLDLSNNMILGKITHLIDLYLLMPRFQNLEYLDISKQFKFSLHGNTDFNNPDSPSTSGNLPVYLPQKLKYLYFNGLIRNLGTIPNVQFIGGSNLLHLNLSYTMLTLYNGVIKGLENLRVLDLSQNNCRFMNRSVFDNIGNLTTLRLSRVNLDTNHIFSTGKRLFQPLKKLKNLDLTNNLLTSLPNDIFEYLTELQVVSLSYNNLISVPDLLQLVNLKSIYLSFNALVTIDRQTRNTLDAHSVGNRFHASFYGNTFACICENSDLLDWFMQTRVDLDGRIYSCVDWKGELINTNSVYMHYQGFQQHCISGTWFTVSITGSSIILLAILTCFIFVKNKLKVKLFLLRMIGRYIQPKKREEFRYDVCVLYADDVYQWVCLSMYEELEKRRGLKLYLRDKDEPIGEDKPQELYNSMESSWKVVLILTPGFLADDFSVYAMSVCLSFITLTTPNRLMLIIDRDMDIPTNIDYFLEAVNEENVYRYDINSGFDDDPQFWNNIYNGITARNL